MIGESEIGDPRNSKYQLDSTEAIRVRDTALEVVE